MSKNIVQQYLAINILVKISVAIILGIIVGILFVFFQIDASGTMAVIKPFGDILIRLLKMIVVPVISLSLIVGAASLATSKLGSVGVKILVIYFFTNALAVGLGLLFANIFKPGMNLSLASPDAVQAVTINTSTQGIGTVLINIIPDNVLQALVRGDVLAIIFFAFIFGIALARLRERGVKAANTLLEVLEGAMEAIYLIVSGIMQYAPIGVFALIFIVFATHGYMVLGPLLYVIIICYVAYLVQLFIVFGTILRVNNLSIPVFFKRTSEALITAFVTRTSSGTLPISMKNMDR
ncbi:MAG: dicarboxylate/amino acid:cation symporter, partial [Brevinema sp.]